MNQVFNGQSLLQLKIDTGIILTGATELKILYKKPNGTTGEWIVTTTEGTKLVYNIGDTDIDAAGTWELQAYVLTGGKKGYGEIIKQVFKQKLN